MNKVPKRYLTKKALSQRIGLTQTSLDTVQDIAAVLRQYTHRDFSRSLLIRRAIEVYAEFLLQQNRRGLLYAEGDEVEQLKGIRGRPRTSKATAGGI